ncbi:hypothetical protein GCM10010198_48670 [Nocardia seriolae]
MPAQAQGAVHIDRAFGLQCGTEDFIGAMQENRNMAGAVIASVHLDLPEFPASRSFARPLQGRRTAVLVSRTTFEFGRMPRGL